MTVVILQESSGAPLELITYDPRSSELRFNVLAPPSGSREPTGIVPAGIWQAARGLGDWSLVGCNVGPGFELEDFRFVATLPDHSSHFTGALSRYAGLLGSRDLRSPLSVRCEDVVFLRHRACGISDARRTPEQLRWRRARPPAARSAR